MSPAVFRFSLKPFSKPSDKIPVSHMPSRTHPAAPPDLPIQAPVEEPIINSPYAEPTQ